MILSTSRLFRRLLRTLDIKTVCDVGSMDGTDALRFRQVLPDANIIALEPNPENFALMQTDRRLADQSIRCFPFAACNHASEKPFYVVDADYAMGRDRFRRGMSSLHRRFDGTQLAKTVQVRTIRLDDFLAVESPDGRPVALWIDTEGSAFEVIDGAEAALPSTLLVHVEVETQAIIGADQKLFRDVKARLEDAGFALLGTDQPPHNLQFNALFVQANVLRSKATAIRYWAGVMFLLRLAARIGVRLMPRKLRKKLAMLLH